MKVNAKYSAESSCLGLIKAKTGLGDMDQWTWASGHFAIS